MESFTSDEDFLKSLTDIILSGKDITEEQAYLLEDIKDRQALRHAAELVTEKMCDKVFDPCSIINARSGRCSEDCKWCAQSAHYKAKCDTYDLVNHEACLHAAQLNKDAGVNRFSLVASGHAVRGRSLDSMCQMLKEIHDSVGIHTCASLGLLDQESMHKLKEAGVTRYHCNLETAPSHFSTLCTTHTIEQKMETLRAAREAGLEVCSGGIIGMGESVRQRIEFALTLRRVKPASIPVNVLCPIPGTPLADVPLMEEDEILDTLAIIRLIHPRVQIRFAGGRARMSEQGQLEAMRIAVNGAIMGDMLTTVGSTVEHDKKLIEDAGYTMPGEDSK
ncbi:MAG: biotin synthase BioB [Muribaculaceae bacterium]|nr:biotin synthase BioB [Muribaculaceae bacterium]